MKQVFLDEKYDEELETQTTEMGDIDGDLRSVLDPIFASSHPSESIEEVKRLQNDLQKVLDAYTQQYVSVSHNYQPYCN